MNEKNFVFWHLKFHSIISNLYNKRRVNLHQIRKIGLFLPSLFLFISLTNVVTGNHDVAKKIHSSGSFSYPNTLTADFEFDDSFKWGVDAFGDYLLYDRHIVDDTTPPYWTRGSWPAYQNPDKLLFQPNNQIVQSGSQSAKLSVLDTSTDAVRRLEILHDWDPYSTYLWSVKWFYFPSSLKPLDSWVAFDRLVYERMWNPDIVVNYQNFQISISVMTDTRSTTIGQQIFVLTLGKGTVDNDNDGDSEIWPYMNADLYSNKDSNQNVPSSWLTKQPNQQLPLDRWFKVTTLVYRNFSDYNNGYVKVWIDEKLIWDVEETRTIGINPSFLKQVNPYPIEPQGYACSGFGLYTEIGSKPKTIYVDNVILSTSSNSFTP